MARHFRQVHPGTDVPKKPTSAEGSRRTYGGQKVCAVCSSRTMRMDLHLVRKHGLVKGSPDYAAKLRAATVPQDASTEGTSDLSEALVEYG
jgi:hypothetical protein